MEVNGGAGGVNGAVEITPTALDSNIGFIDTPRFVGRPEITTQPLFQFGTVTLHPTRDRRVTRFQTALGEQLFDIAATASSEDTSARHTELALAPSAAT